MSAPRPEVPRVEVDRAVPRAVDRPRAEGPARRFGPGLLSDLRPRANPV